MSTSKKHRDFVSEPMGDKPVTDLAGIGDALGQKLIERNYDKVPQTLHSSNTSSLLESKFGWSLQFVSRGGMRTP